MGLYWYLQLLTNSLDQGFEFEMFWTAKCQSTWEDLRVPLSVRKFLFQLEGLSRKKSISVSTVKKNHMRCRTYHYTAALMQEILNIETLTQPHNLPW